MGEDGTVALVAGRSTATIDRRGASLRAVRLDGIDTIQPLPAEADPALAAGAVLFPWPNRVRGARWLLRGEELRLEVTEPAAGNALHGLVLRECFEVVERAPSMVRLRTVVDHHPGYPFTVSLEVEYRLAGDGLEVEMRTVNLGAQEAPVALGAHPYLCVGAQDVAELVLEIPAAQSLLLGPDHLPRELIDVHCGPFDLRDGSPVRDMPGHAVYTDPAPRTESARIERRLHGREGTVMLWSDRWLHWTQVYRTEAFPAVEGGETVTALAVEPMTAPPDALSSGVDLEWLAPGAEWTVRWGLEREQA